VFDVEVRFLLKVEVAGGILGFASLATPAELPSECSSEWDASRQPAWLTSKYSPDKSSRYSRKFQRLRFDHELASRVGMRVKFGEATDRIRGTGGRWRNWWAWLKPSTPNQWFQFRRDDAFGR
jgi:hypothetical protein